MTPRGALLSLFAVPALWSAAAFAEIPTAELSVVDEMSSTQVSKPHPEMAQSAVPEEREPGTVTEEERRTQAARALADSADEAFQRGDYEPAVRNARAAFALVPAPTLVLLEARALRELGHWNDAMARYRLTIEIDELPSNPVFSEAKASARRELQELQASIPRIRIAHPPGTTAGGSVLLDGALLPPESFELWLPQDPGKHTILYTDAAGARQRYALDLKPGEERRLVVGQVDSPGRNELARIAAGWAALGVGSVALAAGIGFGVRAKKLESDLDTECRGNSCPPVAHDTLTKYRTARDLSTVAYILGGTGIAAGTTLLWVWPLIDRHESKWNARVTPTSVALGGTF